MDDEDIQRAKQATGLGASLAHKSVFEIEAYIAALKAEIGRAELELKAKRDVKGAAEALFKKPAAAK